MNFGSASDEQSLFSATRTHTENLDSLPAPILVVERVC